jgi:hypothetical protein
LKAGAVCRRSLLPSLAGTHGAGPGLLQAHQGSPPFATQAAAAAHGAAATHIQLTPRPSAPQGHLPPVTPDDQLDNDEELESFRSDDDGSAPKPELEVSPSPCP